VVKKIYALGQVIEDIRKKHGDRILEVEGEEFEHRIRIKPDGLSAIAKELEEAGFNHLSFVTAVDNLERENKDTITMVYGFYSTFGRDGILIELDLPRDKPEVDSLSSIWKGANWHEREVFDLFGVQFRGHPDLRRILLADDWEGYPLRKDFIHENMIRKPDFF
jgi:NADH-quinone oxidoreductase subunit C